MGDFCCGSFVGDSRSGRLRQRAFGMDGRSLVGCSIMRERFRSNDEGGMSSVTMTIMEKLQGLPSEQQQAVLDMVELLERGEVRQSEAMVAHLETIAGLKQGFKELNAGQTRPIVNFIQSMQQRYDISG